MAIYHYEETPVKRSKGQSAVNSAAYVLKENMRDNNISKDFSYERQNKEVEYSKTLLPEGSNFKNAEEMWNDVEKNEKSEKGPERRRSKAAGTGCAHALGTSAAHVSVGADTDAGASQLRLRPV